MHVEEFREYCLSLPGVSEKMPFPNVADRYSRDVLCFYVGDKWFCFVNIEVFDFCCIKCRPEESTELRARYEGVKPGWHMNKKYWNSVYFNQDVPVINLNVYTFLIFLHSNGIETDIDA